jgi:hypothetical protein
MRSRSGLAAGLATFAVLAGLTATPAAATCKVFAFLVNDYGKDGPTKDAKDLLDKYIAEAMKEKGISKFTVGQKSVTCELFLNLLVVDEHTCKAKANVCWADDGTPKAAAAKAAKVPAKQ